MYPFWYIILLVLPACHGSIFFLVLYCQCCRFVMAGLVSFRMWHIYRWCCLLAMLCYPFWCHIASVIVLPWFDIFLVFHFASIVYLPQFGILSALSYFQCCLFATVKYPFGCGILPILFSICRGRASLLYEKLLMLFICHGLPSILMWHITSFVYLLRFDILYGS